MQSELNSRQWRLYNCLKENGDQFIRQIEIARQLPQYYGEFTEANFHDSQARMLMTKDIRAINESGVIQKIIISSSKGIKLSNEAEFTQYIRAEFGAIFRKLSRTRIKAGKAARNMQGRIVFNSEREFIEAFIGGGEDPQPKE